MDLRVDSTTDGQVLTLVGRGEIDYATLDILETELDKATASDAESVVVDMRDVTYIDSAGLGVLSRRTVGWPPRSGTSCCRWRAPT